MKLLCKWLISNYLLEELEEVAKEDFMVNSDLKHSQIPKALPLCLQMMDSQQIRDILLTLMTKRVS